MSEQINDGGPAFPVPGLQNDASFNGMSLRDAFALSVIGHITASPLRTERSLKQDAAYAYQVADEMLRAREVRNA